MKIKDQIQVDFKEAFKNKETEKKVVLSVLNSEIKNKEIELGKREEGLSDEETIAVVQKSVKQRKDSAAQFRDGGREELAEKEESEIKIIEVYLPEQTSDEEIEAEVKKVIEQTGATSKADMGKVMGAAMSALQGKADGNKVKEMVEKNLG